MHGPFVSYHRITQTQTRQSESYPRQLITIRLIYRIPPLRLSLSPLLLSLSSSSSSSPSSPPPPACTTVHLANENSSGGSSCAHGPATKFNPVNRTLLRNFLSALARARARISPFFFLPLPPSSFFQKAHIINSRRDCAPSVINL